MGKINEVGGKIMFKIENKTIKINRGDIGTITLSKGVILC